MNVKQLPALIGALASAGVFGVIAFFVHPLVTLALASAMCLLGYLVARLAIGKAGGEVARGVLVGVNAAANFALARWLYGALLGEEIGLAVGAALAVVNLLCVVHAIAASDVFQALVGWLNLFMPMSWPIVAVGLAFVLFEALLGLFGLLFKSEFLKLKGTSVDWKTGTFYVKGGLVGNLNFRHTAFSMGTFGFIDRVGSVGYIEHEAGHALNLAAFGSVFHLVGAADENVLGGHNAALAEALAESNNPTPQFTILRMWC